MVRRRGRQRWVLWALVGFACDVSGLDRTGDSGRAAGADAGARADADADADADAETPNQDAGDAGAPTSDLAAAVSAPGPAAVWGGLQSIRWQTTGQGRDRVRIELWSAGQLSRVIVDRVSDAGHFAWDTTQVPDWATYQIRITPTDSQGRAGQTGVSASFAVDNTAPVVVVTAPIGQETWARTQTIAWSTTDAHPGAAAIHLLSGPGGASETVVTASTADVASFAWDTSALADGLRYRVRVTATDAAGNVGAPASSPREFELDNSPPSVTLLSPVGGEIWGGDQPVRWTSSDANRASVDLWLIAESGAGAPTPIATQVADSSAWSWNTRSSGDDARYRVRLVATDAVGNRSAPAESAADFTLDNSPPTLSLLTPFGAEIWSGGRDVTWTSTEANPATVSVEVSATSGMSFAPPVGTASAAGGRFELDTTGFGDRSTYRVRLTATDAAGNVGPPVVSAADLTIDNTPPVVSLISPLGGEVWAGDQTVRWTNLDLHPHTVELRLSVDGGMSFPLVVTATAPDTGAHTWPTATATDADYRLQVIATDLAGNVGPPERTIGDLAVDNTPPQVTLQAPVGGETLSLDANITWSTTDAHPATVTVRLSSDSGATFPTVLAADVEDTGTLEVDTRWIANSSLYRVRVTATDAAGNTGGPDASASDVAVSNTAEGQWVQTSTIGGPGPRSAHLGTWIGGEMLVWGGSGNMGTTRTGARYDPSSDTWQQMNASNGPPGGSGLREVWTGREWLHLGQLGVNNRSYEPHRDLWLDVSDAGPSARSKHAIVWSGREAIIWGGFVSGSGPSNTGARYDPLTLAWSPTTTVAAAAETNRALGAWVGHELVVFGGVSGARYQPSTDTWRPMNHQGAVNTPNSLAVSVWTGRELIVWAGDRGAAAYDPALDRWRPLNPVGLPAMVNWYWTVWTGAEMFVWGHARDGGAGAARYDPQRDAWQPVPTDGAPPRLDPSPSMVWTGREVIIFGGDSPGPGNSDRGYRFIYPRPTTNTWTPTPTPGAPSARTGHSLTWADREAIVWGGTEGGGSMVTTGARYDPVDEAWTALPTAGAPAPRAGHTAVWTGAGLIAWGGALATGTATSTGGLYDRPQDLWLPVNGPVARVGHSAVWTGREMIIWGGRDEAGADTRAGHAFDPTTGQWRVLSDAGAPSARADHSAVWTGRQMIIWGGTGDLFDGARYDPRTDTWEAVVASGAPSGRRSHHALWTGGHMIIWGGSASGGGRYDPNDNTWAALTNSNAPAPSATAVAVWSGLEMIVFAPGGTHGRYDPVEDRWTVMTSAGEPAATGPAVWTGRAMFVWGGQSNEGAQYSP